MYIVSLAADLGTYLQGRESGVVGNNQSSTLKQHLHTLELTMPAQDNSSMCKTTITTAYV